MRSSKKERTLKHVDETMSEIGESISDIANHRENLDCLESFVECQDIVNFLKDFKGTINSYPSFISRHAVFTSLS